MRTDVTIVTEWQTGSALNQAVRADRRGDFGLLLSMMVQDVCCHGQFELAKDDAGNALSSRQRLELPEPQRPTEHYRCAERGMKSAEAFHHGGLVASRLQHCMAPEPFVYQGEHSQGLAEAYANADPAARQRRGGGGRPLPGHYPLSELIAEQRLQSQYLATA